LTNKILKSGILSAAAVFALSQCAVADITVAVEEKNRHKIELSEPVREVSSDLFESKEDMLKYYLENQKKMDIEDIKVLWESTVERNPVVTFALQKISLPPEKRRINSSRMSKVVATLIRGAAMVPGILGADPMTSSASTLSGGLAGRYIANKSLPGEMPITDTELIQLARLVETLQDRIIKNYYEYKGNLESYKVAKSNTEKFGREYSLALEKGDISEVVTSGTMYKNAERKENQIKQQIKLTRLELERLAGIEAVDNLNLGKTALLEEIKADKQTVNTKNNLVKGKIDYLDTDIAGLAREISFEMQEEKGELLTDLQILWGAAVEKSETIRFAIVKLSNPEGEVEKKSVVKQILSPLASVAPVIGLGLGDPVTAGSAMFGGNLLNSVLSDDGKINHYLSKVTDADLVMLAQETDALQEKLITLYYNYLSALMDLNFVNEMEKQSRESLEIVKYSKPNFGSVANVFHEQLLDAKYQARQEVLSRRMELEQFVGNDALLVVDKNIKDRLACGL